MPMTGAERQRKYKKGSAERVLISQRAYRTRHGEELRKKQRERRRARADVVGNRRVAPINLAIEPAMIGYLAGLLDGEGCIRVTGAFDRIKSRSVSHSLNVRVSNTSDALIAWLLREVGGSVNRLSMKGRERPCYEWSLYGKNAVAFLEAVRPYLIVKRGQCDLALEFAALRRPAGFGLTLDPTVVRRREELKERIHLAKATA